MKITLILYKKNILSQVELENQIVFSNSWLKSKNNMVLS